MTLEVICLKETDQQPAHEIFNGVEITRIPLKRRRGGKLSYVLQYGSFILLAGAILAARTFKRRYDLVHVHNMPDILVFSALIPKLFGAKVILDLHDPMPELMMTIFGLREESYSVRLLKEPRKHGASDLPTPCLTTNEAFRKLFLSRGCPPQKISVVMNSPDEEIFRFYESSSQTSAAPRHCKAICHYVSRFAGRKAWLGFGGRRQSKKAREKIPGAGTEDLWSDHAFSGASDGFGSEIRASLRRSDTWVQEVLKQIPAAIRECDVGIIPNRRSAFTELNMPTRIFEYLSQGKPVIAPHTRGILDYFGPTELILFDLGNAEDLAAKMEYAFDHPEEMVVMVELGQKVYEAHKWSGEQARFASLVKGLLVR